MPRAGAFSPRATVGTLLGVFAAYILVLGVSSPGLGRDDEAMATRVAAVREGVRTWRSWLIARGSGLAEWTPTGGIGALVGATGIAVMAAGFAYRGRRRLAAAQQELEARLIASEKLENRVSWLAERQRDLLDSSHDFVFTLDSEGSFTWVNDRGAGMLDATSDALLGRSLHEVFDPQCASAMVDWLERGKRGDPASHRVEARAHGPSGRYAWLDIGMRLTRRDGLVLGVEAIGRNIELRKRSEAESAAQAAVGRALHESKSLDEATAIVLQEMCSFLQWDYAELWWTDDRFGVLRFAQAWHAGNPELQRFAAGARQRTFSKGIGVAGRTWGASDLLTIPDLAEERDPRCTRLRSDGPFQSALGAPIYAADRVIGVAVFLGLRARSSDEAPLRFYRDVCRQIGLYAERKRVEDALKFSESRKNAVIDAALDCVVSIDHEGRILEFNPAAEKTFGYRRADVLGEPMARLLIPEPLREAYEKAFAERVRTGSGRLEGQRRELEAMRADGVCIPVEVSMTSIHLGTQPVFTAYLRDIRDRKEVERLKDELVSTVSHELRTPLASLRGFVELLLMREYPVKEQRRFLGIIDTEIKRLTKLINEFLDLQRLEAGAVEYAIEDHDLGELIASTLEVFSRAGKPHEYRLDLPEAPLRVRMDPDRIRQVVTNLLSNATKYAPDGGCVTVTASSRDGMAQVAVSDEGIGMEPATLEKLFTKFFRADSTAQRSIGGTGLGLALVKEIVTVHQGKIWAESRMGEGSTFFFTLPLAEPG